MALRTDENDCRVIVQAFAVREDPDIRQDALRASFRLQHMIPHPLRAVFFVRAVGRFRNSIAVEN